MGFCNLIPYFGALIGGAVVVLITLVSTGDILTTIIALVCLLVVQQVDANVIQPRIVADTVGLKPLYVLLAIMIGGGIFGFIGILVAVPVMAIIRMLIVDYIEELNGEDTPLVKKQKEFIRIWLKLARNNDQSKNTSNRSTST
jgi:predicted PurR-regulated permease PerM